MYYFIGQINLNNEKNYQFFKLITVIFHQIILKKSNLVGRIFGAIFGHYWAFFVRNVWPHCMNMHRAAFMIQSKIEIDFPTPQEHEFETKLALLNRAYL
jgi:hypothetical protein